jgi:hypothetical protein
LVREFLPNSISSDVHLLPALDLIGRLSSHHGQIPPSRTADRRRRWAPSAAKTGAVRSRGIELSAEVASLLEGYAQRRKTATGRPVRMPAPARCKIRLVKLSHEFLAQDTSIEQFV